MISAMEPPASPRPLACLALLLLTATHESVAHDRPIIGILAVDVSSTYGDSMIPANYVKFLMMGGARVVPVRINEAEPYYVELFSKINGLLLPGGRVDTLTSEYAKAARILLRLAMESNKAGDYFPVWGICLGSQAIVNIMADRKRTSSTPGMADVSLPLHLKYTGRMIKDMPSDVLHALTTEPITYNTHNWGIRPAKFETDPNLKGVLGVVSTNTDTNGRDFVSMYEAIDPAMPIYGTQFHPEKVSFAWGVTKHVNHSLNAVRAAQHMANFFVQEARGSNHVMGPDAEEGKAVIQNYEKKYFNSGTYNENYYFNFRASNRPNAPR